MLSLCERSHEEEQHSGESVEYPSAPQVCQAEDKHPHCRGQGSPHFQGTSHVSTLAPHQVQDVVDRELQVGCLWKLPDLCGKSDRIKEDESSSINCQFCVEAMD